MLILFLVLAGLSLACMIAGIVWAVVASRKVETREGPEVGAEMVAAEMADDSEGTVFAQRASFRGQAMAVGGTETTSFADIKGAVKTGDWGRALPSLLAVCGLLGLLFFASLAGLVGLESPWFGLAALAVSIYVIVRTVYGIIQA